jgi:hypothetical protein
MSLRAEMARFTCRRAAIVGDRKKRRVMAHTDKQKTSPLREAAGPTDPNQVDFGRKLRARGNAAKGRPADKAFRDSLFDDS